MKPEPLTKEKIFRCVEKGKNEGYRVVFIRDVKSAVQGLLEEIEKEIRESEEREEEVKKVGDYLEVEWELGIQEGLTCAKNLIKKWFEAVSE